MNDFKNNKPHGYWTSYYPGSNKLFYRGTYNNGKKVGYWIFLDRNEKIVKKSFYI